MVTEEKSKISNESDEEPPKKTTTQQASSKFVPSKTSQQEEDDDDDDEDAFWRKNEPETKPKGKELSKAEISNFSDKSEEEVKHNSLSRDEDEDHIDSPPKFDSKVTTESVYSKKTPILSTPEIQSTETSYLKPKQTFSSREHTPPASDRKVPPSNTTTYQKSQTGLGTTGGAKAKTPVVINTQEIEKNMKSINIFKKNAADAEHSHSATTKPSMQVPSNLANLNPSKYASNDRDTVQSTQSSQPSRYMKPEPTTSDRNPVQEYSKPNEGNVVPERESTRGKHFELEKKVLTNKLETAELQLRQLKEENEGLREEVESKDSEIVRFKGLLETAKKKINELSYSKSQTDASNSDSDRLRELLESQNADNARLIQENSDLNDKIDELKKLMYNNNKENAKKLKDMQMELDKHKGSSNENERELTTLKEQKNALADKCARLESDLRNVMKTAFDCVL